MGGGGFGRLKVIADSLWISTVMDLLEEKGFIPPEFVENETKWFYSSLGIDGKCFHMRVLFLTTSLTELKTCTSSLRHL